MARHEVTVEGFSYRDVSYHPTKHAGEAGIIVEPPIVVGELFTRAILGADANGVTLRHVVSTTDQTVFIAHAGDNHERKTEAQAHAAIATIKDRIKQLAESPDDVIDLMQQNPFPDEPQPRRVLSQA